MPRRGICHERNLPQLHREGLIIPRALRKPCRWPGCPELTHDRFCPAHAKKHSQQYEESRPSSHQRGYGRRWQRIRRIILRRDPICKICGRAPSTEVDHIIPREAGGTDDPDNLQGACKPCHSRKTAQEDGRWGGGGAIAQGARSGDRPVSLAHTPGG